MWAVLFWLWIWLLSLDTSRLVQWPRCLPSELDLSWKVIRSIEMPGGIQVMACSPPLVSQVVFLLLGITSHVSHPPSISVPTCPCIVFLALGIDLGLWTHLGIDLGLWTPHAERCTSKVLSPQLGYGSFSRIQEQSAFRSALGPYQRSYTINYCKLSGTGTGTGTANELTKRNKVAL